MNATAVNAIAAQQRAITVAAPLFVRACPGAGKTRVIVSRHLEGPAPTLRGGRALLSYTRAAAQQIRDRCHRLGRPELTADPHYVGTLDGFVWNHLVAPYRSPRRPLQLIDSWDRVQATVTVNHRTMPLSAFVFSYAPATGTETIRLDLMPPAYARLIRASGRSYDEWVEEAFAVRRVQCARGYVTGHESRQLALQYLHRDQELAATLRSRFHEIIVDEAQDCSITDLEILDRLRVLGMPLVVVADPDQMIYGWRDADPTRLAQLESDLGATVTLDGNWRSSTTICQLAATLRANRRSPDVAIQATGPEPPVILLPAAFPRGGGATHPQGDLPITDMFINLAQRYGISAHQCLITSHRRAHLPGTHRQISANPTTDLARAWRVLHSPTDDPDAIDSAVQAGARVLLRYWYPDLAPIGRLEDRCAQVELDPRVLARYAYAFVYALPEPGPAWPSVVNQRLKTGVKPAGAVPRRTAGYLRGIAEQPTGGGDFDNLTCRIANIHQIKGAEFPAVLLLIPNEDVSARWTGGDPFADEVLRTWYVAVTRAQRLVAIAAGARHLSSIAEHLRQRGVPVIIEGIERQWGTADLFSAMPWVDAVSTETEHESVAMATAVTTNTAGPGQPIFAASA